VWFNFSKVKGSLTGSREERGKRKGKGKRERERERERERGGKKNEK